MKHKGIDYKTSAVQYYLNKSLKYLTKKKNNNSKTRKIRKPVLLTTHASKIGGIGSPIGQVQEEIMTIKQLKEYRLLFYNKINKCIDGSGYHDSRALYHSQLNKYMDDFMVMQDQEKIIWAFNSKFDYAGSNILLTNKGKILLIEFNVSPYYEYSSGIQTLIEYEINNHNFDIPSYAIHAIKILIKNISGRYENPNFDRQAKKKINNEDFKSFYRNINEYLKQLKQEQLQTEQLKQEQLQTEQLKQEQLQTEQLKQEQIKQEKLKQEQITIRSIDNKNKLMSQVRTSSLRSMSKK